MATPLAIVVKLEDLPLLKPILHAAAAVVEAHPDLPLVRNLRDALQQAVPAPEETDAP